VHEPTIVQVGDGLQELPGQGCQLAPGPWCTVDGLAIEEGAGQVGLAPGAAEVERARDRAGVQVSQRAELCEQGRRGRRVVGTRDLQRHLAAGDGEIFGLVHLGGASATEAPPHPVPPGERLTFRHDRIVSQRFSIVSIRIFRPGSWLRS